MKKVFIDYNAKDNFGDDLLVKILCGYFPQIEFTALVPKNRGKAFSTVKNLNIVETTPRNADRRYKRAAAKSEASICLGSGHLSSKISDKKKFWEHKTLIKTKPVYFINADYEESDDAHFNRFVYEYVSDCQGVWFRDKRSAAAFPLGEYMPDLSFMTEFNSANEDSSPYAVLSVVDLSGRPEISVLHDNYISTMKKVAAFLKEQGYHVIILAMCRYEWDDLAAAMLAEYGEIVCYDGKNFDDILSLINGAECVAGSRFYAITTALAAGKRIIPIGYDERFTKLMESIDSKHPCLDIRNPEGITDETLLAALNFKSDVKIDDIKAKIAEEIEKIEKNLI